MQAAQSPKNLTVNRIIEIVHMVYARHCVPTQMDLPQTATLPLPKYPAMRLQGYARLVPEIRLGS
jgi:hypothetical protein